MQVEGQAAIVSGGGSGLGRATAQMLAAAGVKIAILDINEAAAGETAREIGGPNFAGAPPAAQVVIVLRYFRLSGQGSDFRLPDVINYFTPVRQTGRDEVTVLAVQMLAAPS